MEHALDVLVLLGRVDELEHLRRVALGHHIARPKRPWKRHSSSIRKSVHASRTELVVSLDEGPTEDGVEAAWEQELDRRAGEIDSGAVKLEPWSELRQELDGIVHGS